MPGRFFRVIAAFFAFTCLCVAAHAVRQDVDARWSEGARAVLQAVPDDISRETYRELRETWLATIRPALVELMGEGGRTRATVVVRSPENQPRVLVFSANGTSRDRVTAPAFETEPSRNLPRIEVAIHVFHSSPDALLREYPLLAPQAELPPHHRRVEFAGHPSVQYERPDGQMTMLQWLAGDRVFVVEARGDKSGDETTAYATRLHEATSSRGGYVFPAELKIDPIVPDPATKSPPPPAARAAAGGASVRPGAGQATDELVWVRMGTSMGEIVLALNQTRAPISVENFLSYVDAGYYEGTTFHRVIENFMIQGGGYDADFTPKRGLRAPIINEWKNGLKNKRGTIAMARTSDPDSATSQFFINVVDNNGLDQPRDGAAYAVFGSVVEGMETVDRIRFVPTTVRGTVRDVPMEAVLIEKVSRIDDAEVKPQWRADWSPPASEESSSPE